MPHSNINRLVLRHSIVPYRTLGSVFIAAAIWAFVVSYRSGRWGTFESALLLVGIYSLQVIIGMWYRIALHDGVITQRAFGMPRVSISLDEITSVGKETSNAKELLRMNRPFRRICITAGHARARKSIDVSIKHFVAADIETLIAAIHEARPDLAISAQWLRY